MQGMQQQQALNQQLRQNFRFVNQQGGYGFTAGGAGQIGQFMHRQVGQMADVGEQTTFEELGRLAQGMARMGMAQGVRDAKDFTDRFKKMLNSVKEIAKEMGTSLEEAQKVMGGLRQVGIFQPGQAVAASRAIRQGAAAGGLATSEVTGMMNVGAQFSRMIGGRGAAGAVAGANAITNLGVAQQLGIISEEDIYESTGLTGAEGRRAWTQQRLQGTAQFLRSNFGRRLVASMAGERGQLDPASVARFAAGGVSTGETMRMAHEGVRRAGGQAGFMRYEGRMRGELMRQFGADLPVMAVRGWLEERNLLVNEVRDRDMLGLQKVLRRGGVRVGQVELEQMVEQARELPRIMAERRRSGEEQQWAENITRKRRGRGIEGLKRDLEAARTKVQSSLQEAGSSFYQGGAEMIERFVNRLADNYVATYRKDVDQAFQTVRRGGPAGETALARTFGLTRGAGGQMEKIDFGLTTAFGQRTQAQTNEYMVNEFTKRDWQSYRKAGFGELFRGMGEGTTAERAQVINRGRQQAQKMAQIISGIGGPKVDVQMSDVLRGRVSAMLSSGLQSKGLDRINELQTRLQRLGTPEAATLAGQLGSEQPLEKRAAAVREILSMAGGDKERQQEEAAMFGAPKEEGMYEALSPFVTEGEREEKGGRLLSRGGTAFGRTISRGGRWRSQAADWRERGEQAFAYAQTEEGRTFMARALTEGAGARGDIEKALQRARREEGAAGGDITTAAGGRAMWLQRAALGTHLREMLRGGKKVSDLTQAQRETLVERARDYGMFQVGDENLWETMGLRKTPKESPEEYRKRVAKAREEFVFTSMKGGVSVMKGMWAEASAQQKEMAFKRSSEEIKSLTRAGVVQNESGQLMLSENFVDKLTTSLGDSAGAAKEYMQALMDEQKALASKDPEAADAARERQRGLIESRSVKELRGFATAAAMGGMDEASYALSQRARIQKALGTRGDGRERISRFASMMGLDMSRKDVAKYLGKSGMGQEALIERMSKQLGLKTPEERELLTKGIQGLGAGGAVNISQSAEMAQQLMQTESIKKLQKDQKDAQVAKRAEDYAPMGKAIANQLMNIAGGLPVKVIQPKDGGTAEL
jgi:hypothetical protein